MRVEEIALRQEIRQMLNEVGINKNTLLEMAKEVMQKEIEKQVKNAVNQSNIDRMVWRGINSYEIRDMVREALKKELCGFINETVDIKINVKEKTTQKEV